MRRFLLINDKGQAINQVAAEWIDGQSEGGSSDGRVVRLFAGREIVGQIRLSGNLAGIVDSEAWEGKQEDS